MTTAVATRQQGLVEFFEKRKDKFSEVMESPEHVSRFLQIVKNAVLRDPEIAEASTQSVFLECQKAAADGLVLDGREAVLTRFKTNKRRKEGDKWVDNWQTEVVYIPMIKGLTKLVAQSPQIADWHTGLVYEREYEEGRFDYQAGDTPSIKHLPIIIGERGPVVAAYSVVRLRSGVLKIEVMTRGQLDAIKARTKSKKRGTNGAEGEITGPWASDEDEMFRKTVARRHFKSLPLSEKADAAVSRVDGLYDFAPGESHMEIEPIEPKAIPAAVANKRKGSAAAKLAAARPQPGPDADGDPKGDDDAKTVDHDPETGEIDGEAINADDDF